MKSRSNPRRGQTILLFSMSTVVMFGMLGLVVDLGWGYFRKQSAQAAAQSAAIAAVSAADGRLRFRPEPHIPSLADQRQHSLSNRLRREDRFQLLRGPENGRQRRYHRNRRSED